MALGDAPAKLVRLIGELMMSGGKDEAAGERVPAGAIAESSSGLVSIPGDFGDAGRGWPWLITLNRGPPTGACSMRRLLAAASTSSATGPGALLGVVGGVPSSAADPTARRCCPPAAAAAANKVLLLSLSAGSSPLNGVVGGVAATMTVGVGDAGA